MKHTLNIILGGLFLLISYSINAQVNILDKEKYLLINDSIKISKGSAVTVNKPYQFDFISIQQQQSFNLKKVAKITGIASVGGALGTSIGGIAQSSDIIIAGTQIVNQANNVSNIIWTADQINQLNASSKEKMIVGKKFIVDEWNFDAAENTFFLIGKIENKKYKIFLQNAIILNEINL